MSAFVGEEDLDYDEIYRRGGANYSEPDEDFALFRCPFCERVHLIDYEVDTVYLDGRDFSIRVDPSPHLYCAGCRCRVPDDKAWVGHKSSPTFRVTWELLARSDWAWTVKKMRDVTP